MHEPWDENYQRGYEWWLMTEAKKVFRPPGTLVPNAFCFSRDVFNQTQDLRAPSADRRETLHSDQHMRQLFNASPKIRGSSPKKFRGQKHAKFGPISYNFRL